MTPPIYAILYPSAALRVALGDPLRLYPGVARQAEMRPYLVYQSRGTPEQFLSQPSDNDSVVVQLDIYATDRDQAEQIAELVRQVIEKVAYVVAFNEFPRDNATNLSRFSLDAEFRVSRSLSSA